MKLYDYYRSSAAYRVRIVLNLKSLPYQSVPVNLVRGEQSAPGHLARQPQGLVPALELDNGLMLRQSLAICEYLDEAYPQPPLMPPDAEGRARVRALAQTIACDIHPLDNLRVLRYLTGILDVSEADKLDWYRHWIHEGFRALESLLTTPETGYFCHGDQPTLADACLVPQLFNARRFDCDLSPYPTLVRIGSHCETLDAFSRAHPSQQPDAPRT
ncbi:maleylacetoacetate isomerase [Mangrovitalea sediminis]|uniref:maleylacetoacetate isomerase n=1 Tax=Mangrovitalea sediminis TaxID=1982043 RepID=UPI000BE4EF3A|nr:maleylacetoacetate isomerase [Mangrovitalea sediminis]